MECNGAFNTIICCGNKPNLFEKSILLQAEEYLFVLNYFFIQQKFSLLRVEVFAVGKVKMCKFRGTYFRV